MKKISALKFFYRNVENEITKLNIKEGAILEYSVTNMGHWVDYIDEYTDNTDINIIYAVIIEEGENGTSDSFDMFITESDFKDSWLYERLEEEGGVF